MYSAHRLCSEVIKPIVETVTHISIPTQNNDAVAMEEVVDKIAIPNSNINLKALSDLILNSLGSLSGEYFPPPEEHS